MSTTISAGPDTRHSPLTLPVSIWGLVLAVSCVVGCGEGAAPAEPGASKQGAALGDDAPVRDDAAWSRLALKDDALDRALEDGALHHRPETSFRQISLMFSSHDEAPLEYRVRYATSGEWSPWRPVEVTWREDEAHVARGLLETAAVAVEFRTEGALRGLYAEFPPKQTARTDRPLTRDLPVVDETDDRDDDGVETRRQHVAPRSLVIPRSDWSARDPNKTCGVPHDPYRMTIHHTYSPDDDGGNPAKRMRQMQAFHIDNRGWCDIGYHFVVSQSGEIYQGRSTEKRTGAHVGGENQGNIGTALIGDYHNEPVITSQLRKASEIVAWIHRTYQIPLDRQKVKGHREWPGQNTSCPGDNLLPKLGTLLKWAGRQNTTGPNYDVEISVELPGLDNPYRQGSSQNVPDAFQGEQFRANLYVTNASDEVLDDVRLGYRFRTPRLKPTDYTIYTDHPAHDRSSWSVNDANSASSNPPPGQMGGRGKLDLEAFSPDETKRVAVVFEARRYSLGTPAPDVRAWVRHVEGVYETKKGWNQSPSTDEVGRDLRAGAAVDVPSRDEWRFDSSASDRDLEGWEGCCGSSYGRLALNRKAGALAAEIQATGAELRTPSWTRIDADAYEQLVLRMRSYGGAHRAAVYWKRRGESFEETRGLQFRVPGGGSFQTLVIPLDSHDAWRGRVTGLRIVPRLERSPGAGKEEWHDVDALYFQSTDDRSTTSSRYDFDETQPVVASPIAPPEDPRPDAGEMSPDTGWDAGSPDAAPDVGPSSDADSSPDASPRPPTPSRNIPSPLPFDSERVRVNDGCSTSASGSTPPILVFLVGIYGFACARRRH